MSEIQVKEFNFNSLTHARKVRDDLGEILIEDLKMLKYPSPSNLCEDILTAKKGWAVKIEEIAKSMSSNWTAKGCDGFPDWLYLQELKAAIDFIFAAENAGRFPRIIKDAETF